MRRLTVRVAVMVGLVATVACGGDADGLADTIGEDAPFSPGSDASSDSGQPAEADSTGWDVGAGPDGVTGADAAVAFDGAGTLADAEPPDAGMDAGMDAVAAPDGSTTQDASVGADAANEDAIQDAASAGDADTPDAGAPDTIGGDTTPSADTSSCFPALCDDGDPCTVDTCDGDACAHAPLPCGDGDPCTTDACEAGVCTHVYAAATCPTPCPQAMEPVAVEEATVCVDRWEASRADASATSIGAKSDLPPTSRPGVYPWTKLSQADAAAACTAAGKRLCTFTELGSACGGPEALHYPWGNTYDENACNGYASGLAKVALTGSFLGCASPEGVLDVSGNVQEWTSTVSDQGNTCVFGGDYFAGNLSPEANQDSESCDPTLFQCIAYADPDTALHTNLGFRCCAEPAGAL